MSEKISLDSSAKTTLYRYLVYTGLHLPINCQQEGWEEYGIYH